MKVKILCKTPKNQAKKCIESHKKAIVGLMKAKDIVEQKITKHNEFYWILKVEDDAEYHKVMKSCAKGEILIKRFYGTLMKLIARANFLCNKLDKKLLWARRWIIKRLKKIGENTEMIQKIETMSDEELKDFMDVTDKEEMEKLLAGDLIDLTVVEK